MFDELAIVNGSRLMLIAGISYTLWSLSGVIWRGWSVGEVFFWMWWEILLSGISTAFLLLRWHRLVHRGVVKDRLKAVCGILVSVLLILSLATLFTILALKAENVNVLDLPSYLDHRQATLLVLALLTLVVHLMTAHGTRFRRMTRQEVEKPLMNRAFAVLGLYLVIICAHHWSGSTRWESDSSNQMLLGCALLGTKLLLELWQFFKVPRPNSSPAVSSAV